jgi:hypothetical protein
VTRGVGYGPSSRIITFYSDCEAFRFTSLGIG